MPVVLSRSARRASSGGPHRYAPAGGRPSRRRLGNPRLENGLGSINTDLGRWIPGHDGLGQLEGGLGLILAGGVVVILRRRRRSSGPLSCP